MRQLIISDDCCRREGEEDGGLAVEELLERRARYSMGRELARATLPRPAPPPPAPQHMAPGRPRHLTERQLFETANPVLRYDMDLMIEAKNLVNRCDEPSSDSWFYHSLPHLLLWIIHERCISYLKKKILKQYGARVLSVHGLGLARDGLYQA